MQIIVSIADVWLTHNRGESLFLERLGLRLEDLVRCAFGFMVVTARPPTHSAPIGLTRYGQAGNIVDATRRMIQDRLPAQGQSVYDADIHVDDQSVHRVVDMIGEISQLMLDSVTHQIGHIPIQLRLLRFSGPDVILQYHEDSSEYPLPHSLPQGGSSRL